MVYKFEDSLVVGERYEKILDDYYSRWYVISNISVKAQKFGIDRIWASRNSRYRYSVEYKADETATRTGNAFIEIWSNVEDEKPGWAYTSCAQTLIYYLPLSNEAYRMSVLTLKYFTEIWEGVYEHKSIPNDGYHTSGILVPLDVFAEQCYHKETIPAEK